MKLVFRILAAAVVVLVAAQFIPVARTNPPVTGDLPAPADVKNLLRTACYDCHSHETVWPWYSRVAPVSWLVAHDVKEGRGMVNFSTWDQYRPQKQAALREMAADEIQKRDMPPATYTWQHPQARLTDAQIGILTNWLLNGN